MYNYNLESLDGLKELVDAFYYIILENPVRYRNEIVLVKHLIDWMNTQDTPDPTLDSQLYDITEKTHSVLQYVLSIGST